MATKRSQPAADPESDSTSRLAIEWPSLERRTLRVGEGLQIVWELVDETHIAVADVAKISGGSEGVESVVRLEPRYKNDGTDGKRQAIFQIDPLNSPCRFNVYAAQGQRASVEQLFVPGSERVGPISAAIRMQAFECEVLPETQS